MRSKRIFGLLTATLTLFAVCCLTGSVYADKPMTADDFISECICNNCLSEITVEEARKILGEGDCLFIDCRTEKEFKRGSIPNSVLIQRGLIEFKVAKQAPDKNTKIIIYCKSGKRSALTTCTLTKMGYSNVLSMTGGWKAWIDAGYPVN